MTQSDLTIKEILRDPMILQVLKADGVQLSGFATLLREVASREKISFASSPRRSKRLEIDRKRKSAPSPSL